MATITFHDGKSKTKAGAGYRGYHTLASLRRVIDYETKEEKTEPWLIGTKNCNAATAYEEMVLCKEMYDKAQEDGKNRMLIHFSQNLVAGETTPQIAHEIAERLLQHPIFKGFQVIYATHIDTENLHTHFVINSVSLEDGHKWQLSKAELQELKDYSDSIIREYELYVVPKKEREKQEESYKSQHQIRMERVGTSWKKEIYLAVKSCSEIAGDRTEFVQMMKKLGYQVEWSDTRKYITFTDTEGHKLRNRKLYPQAKFTKEALEQRFALNKQYQEINKEREQWEKVDAANSFLRLINSISKTMDTKYPLQRMEKDYSSMAARKELAKEAEKGSGFDWENE